MSAIFSFALRKSNEVPKSGKQFDTTNATGDHHQIDPWNLGVTTSTSTTESVTQHSAGEETMMSTRTPPTPEGLRPRKSIQNIRREILECDHYPCDMRFQRTQILFHDSAALPSRPPPSFPISHSLYREFDRQVKPPPIHRTTSNRIPSSSSFYDQTVDRSILFDDEIDSSIDHSYSQHSRAQSRHRQIALSPDLERGGKPKTAVGALLVAMAETSTKPSMNMPVRKNGLNPEQLTSKPILPPRTWMDNHSSDDQYLEQHADEDDTIRDEFELHDEGDDNQSSLHMSPSSLERMPRGNIGSNGNIYFEQDTSFTRRILNDDPSSSRLEERSIGANGSPYNFNSIMVEDPCTDLKNDSFDAPRVLSLVDGNEGLNLSAISHSQHQKEMESTNTSLADTLEEEEEEEEEDCREIPMYYQALTDDVAETNVVNDDDIRVAKAQNQRQHKEDVLKATFERLRDSLSILNDVCTGSTVEDSFFLGLDDMKTVAQYYRHLEALFSEFGESDSTESRLKALKFCMSSLQKTAAFSSSSPDQQSDFSPSFPSPSHTRWMPIPGFRSSLGLEEEPQSPVTLRGGDTSMFSLPSESANDSTPHTSNVSLTTTLTTVISPEKHGTDSYKQTFGTRTTMETIARLLKKLEQSCLQLKSGMTRAEKESVVQSIEDSYFHLIDIPLEDLEQILHSFETDFCAQRGLGRKSNYETQLFSELKRGPRLMCGENRVQTDSAFFSNHLRVNIVQCDEDDIDNDNRNQSIECDLWSPTTNDMRSLISSKSIEDRAPGLTEGYVALVEDEADFDDLRRVMGSFDEESVVEERDSAPPENVETIEPNRDHLESFPATFARRVVAQRPRRARFWKKGFMALKSRRRPVTAE